jgi:DNA-binding HxlR family transcriptional regulator
MKIIGKWFFEILKFVEFRPANFNAFIKGLDISSKILSDKLNFMLKAGFLKKFEKKKDFGKVYYAITEEGLRVLECFKLIRNLERRI